MAIFPTITPERRNLQPGQVSAFGGVNYDDLIRQIIESLPEQQFVEVPDFAFDEIEARRRAEQEFDPFFQEQVEELLMGTGTQRTRLGEDLETALQNLSRQQRYTREDLTRDRERALGQLAASYADRNLRRSGGRVASQRQTQEDYRRALQRAGTSGQVSAQEAQRRAARQREDIAEQERMGQKRLAEQRRQAVGQAVGSDFDRAMRQYMRNLGLTTF